MVLVKGRPGVGKTTTCEWLHREWALGEFAARFSIFFVVHIRHLIHVKVSTAIIYTVFDVISALGAYKIIFMAFMYLRVSLSPKLGNLSLCFSLKMPPKGEGALIRGRALITSNTVF